MHEVLYDFVDRHKMFIGKLIYLESLQPVPAISPLPYLQKLNDFDKYFGLMVW